MADYVDITDEYMVAGDYDSRKRYIRNRTGGSNPLAVCSGVTWRIGTAGTISSAPVRTYYWQLGSRGTVSFSAGAFSASAPTPQRVTDCMI